MTVRQERPEDADAIRAVEEAAFGKPDEARIPDALRGTEEWAVSLVAEEDGRIVGHVLLSWARLEGRPVLLLGPIGVLPERQGVGIGSALVEAALAWAEEQAEPLVALEGNPAYYSRFGFRPAHEFGVVGPPPNAQYVQVRPLAAYDPTCRGRLEYPQAFSE